MVILHPFFISKRAGFDGPVAIKSISSVIQMGFAPPPLLHYSDMGEGVL